MGVPAGVGSGYAHFEVLGGGVRVFLTRSVIIEVSTLHRGPNMQIKRLLGDQKVWAGDKLFDAQGRPYAFLELSSAELVVAAGDGHPIRFKPDELGCYVIHVNRTERGLAKERLRDYWYSLCNLAYL